MSRTPRASRFCATKPTWCSRRWSTSRGWRFILTAYCFLPADPRSACARRPRAPRLQTPLVVQGCRTASRAVFHCLFFPSPPVEGSVSTELRLELGSCQRAQQGTGCESGWRGAHSLGPLWGRWSCTPDTPQRQYTFGLVRAIRLRSGTFAR